MTFSEFESRAEREWDRIPEDYKLGVDALVVTRDAKAQGRSDVYILGECVTESWPSDFDGPDTIRSELVLYYGSFRRLAARDDAFDWEAELWETLTHELRHHLESLAAEDDLEDLDAAMEQHFRRHDGEPFDPYYFRGGEPLGSGWFRLEEAFFLEVDGAPEGAVSFEWSGQRYAVRVSVEDMSITYVTVTAVADAPDELVIVVVPKRPLRWRIRALLRPRPVAVLETTAAAERT